MIGLINNVSATWQLDAAMLRAGDNFPTFHVKATVAMTGLAHDPSPADLDLARSRTIAAFGKLNREFADRDGRVRAFAMPPGAAAVARVVRRATFIVDPRGVTAA